VPIPTNETLQKRAEALAQQQQPQDPMEVLAIGVHRLAGAGETRNELETYKLAVKHPELVPVLKARYPHLFQQEEEEPVQPLSRRGDTQRLPTPTFADRVMNWWNRRRNSRSAQVDPDQRRTGPVYVGNVQPRLEIPMKPALPAPRASIGGNEEIGYYIVATTMTEAQLTRADGRYQVTVRSSGYLITAYGQKPFPSAGVAALAMNELGL
jgi:hypothetical protein